MRKRSEVMTWTAYALVVGWLAVALPFPGVPAALDFLRNAAARVFTVPMPADNPGENVSGPTGAEWFAEARPRCTAEEVTDHLARTPAPAGMEGAGYAAACLALAGEIDEARDRILENPIYRHVSDALAGSAEYHQALYHAGSARFQQGDHDAARRYLARFVEEYRVDDAWTRDARRMLEEMGVG